ncbi:hypothetical protein EWM64_g2853 [Hericium alpestre]|uniref:NADP-dependent oxidoreductase domain-containing protein n=1 Tax=Hericium alpestre TaxID=135208 RepID=A0A4Z0A3Z0_9AGAM|nr:hypothetical protein EWM64_g2853 [Hericium alpestre]
MKGLQPLFCVAPVLYWLISLPFVSADIRDVVRKQKARHESFMQKHTVPAPAIRASDDDSGLLKRQDGSTIHFANPKAQEFFVDGTKIPDVEFDAGPSWSGLIPISGKKNETRKLFFWFWPTTNVSNANDLLFWTNGGPGCSSLEGFLQENGPICSLVMGTVGTHTVSHSQFCLSRPRAEDFLIRNPWSWTNLSNVVWVEQPVGTGFSQGEPDISNDDELAAEVFGFLQQFLEVFQELKGSNFWVSGESYAGFYVPYIANYIYEHPGGLDLDLKGIWIADPSLTYDAVQEEIPALRFAQANQNVFPFNSSFWAELQTISDECGYTDYLDKFVTYPPKGQLPLVGTNGTFRTTRECDIYDLIVDEVSILNPAFDIYRVTEAWPVPWSVLGFPRSTQEFVYFNRTDVQDAIHAPHIVWEACANGDVYINATTGRGGRDQSIPSTLSVLPNVIEKSERVAIIHGLADFILVAEGTRIAIQNMTWGGAQGFQNPIENETFTVKDIGVYGNTHEERGLTYVEFYYSGHMTPRRAIYKKVTSSKQKKQEAKMLETAVEVSVPALKLNNGTQMPVVGLGCWMGTPGGGERVNSMVKKALKKLGYRHFDTAAGYANEEQVGDALHESGIPRSQIFVTTKLGNQDHHRVAHAFDDSLRRLRLDYVDLYLMHWPQAVGGNGVTLQPDEHPNIIDTWHEMEKLLDTGRVKAIGVSNFSIKLLEKLLSQARVVPAVNQVELHPCLPQMELKTYCDPRGIALTAYSPLGRPLPKDKRGDLPMLMEEPTIARLAHKYKATPAQILVSWGVRRGTPVIPKSEDVGRLKSNINLLRLEDSDMHAIDAIHRTPGMHRSLLTYHGLDPGRVFGWTYEQMAGT